VFAEGKSKAILELPVFACTALASIWAYFWMLVVYRFWTPGEITVLEAWLTFLFFPMLVLVAYLLDIKPWIKHDSDAEAAVYQDPPPCQVQGRL
jgi:solute carrier family 8 (sodium/calcium exchanger)